MLGHLNPQNVKRERERKEYGPWRINNVKLSMKRHVQTTSRGFSKELLDNDHMPVPLPSFEETLSSNLVTGFFSEDHGDRIDQHEHAPPTSVFLRRGKRHHAMQITSLISQ
ncbi:unnamed protein product [Sphenostylis stenocarpa]|uniref:Uncharacterized protein n=1 Tax=Sphenostylis stenocarpa TaxID=92480 RepID=A0AA86S5A6_9FABA|nr:unnamed protein product [Sphenostylis stenocarpa]